MSWASAVFKTRAVALLQYRAAAISAMATQVFWGIIKTAILTAFFAQGTASTPIALSQAIGFVWLGQAFLRLVPWDLDKELETQVRDGQVAYELVRPIDLYWLWFTRCLAMRCIPVALRAAPVIVVGFYFGLEAPVSWEAACWFGLSLVGAVAVSAAITTLVVISLFWTTLGEGIDRIMPSLSMLLSGLIVPLPLFPDALQPLLNLQPFRAVLDIPIRLYTGVIPVTEASGALVFQIVWAILLIGLGRFCMSRSLHRLEMQGG
ncbi:MAG: ABC transporter permease [Chlamydiia bacterium]